MPIRINLLAEQQAEAEMRRRDPVKRAVLVAVLLVGLMGLWAGWLAFLGRNATAELAAIEEAIKRLDKDSKAATDDLKAIADAKNRLHALETLATNRFLWAPALDALQQSVVENIQLTQLRVEQTYLVKDAEPASKDKKVPAKPASSTERIVLRILARDYGRDQDQTYIKFKDQLLAQPFFKQRLKGENASFSGITAPTTDDEDAARSYFTFTLECAFPEVKRP